MTPVTFALLTDFSLNDQYVGQMKGVLASLCPDARILDLSHDVPPFSVVQGAFFLQTSWSFFPRGTCFICVVDPGVGSSRKILAANCHDRIFLAPDNGLLSLLLAESPQAEVYDVSSLDVADKPSHTFHGRDLFAPLAVRIAQGGAVSELGALLSPEDVVNPAWSAPKWDGLCLITSVLHVDAFGNVILNAPETPWLERIHGWTGVEMRAPQSKSLSVVKSYHELAPGQVGLLAGSQGYLEVAMNMASAAQTLGLDISQDVLLGPGSGDICL